MSNMFQSALRSFGYLLSLPERTVRSFAAVAGGTTSLLTDTLFPDALRGTTMYRIFVGDTQRFVIQKIAQVQQEAQASGNAQPTGDDYVQRKMVGGALEAAGLFAMHFSPLWVFAIAGDVAAGSSVFLQRLVDQLKQNGVIPPDTEVSGLTDLLRIIQDTSRHSATVIDTPPLSVDELSKLADDMVANYGRLFAGATNLLPRMETLWVQMQKVADRQNVSLETLSGILTLDVAQWAKKGIGAAFSLGQTGTDLLGENFLSSYARTLDEVADQGVAQYLSARLTPFLEAAVEHFRPGRLSWTETLFGLGEPAAPEAPA